ncbi:peptidase M18 [Mrakia frigida]|uniref:M18 family aminopeptidase n=1 Tax=Mrakia frigida TaxID=29902 RepID=UPI003FCBF671
MASTTSKAAQGFLDFVNASPTPFHAVANAAKRLEDVGFTKISESDSWGPLLQVGKGYYFTRNQSALCAFVLPKGFKSGDGIGLVGTHVDSCCLKVRPVSKKIKGDFLQTYGGGIWRTWFDRDLSLAGRVIVQTSPDKFVSKLIKIDRPLLRIPSLAIHLDPARESFTFNKETHLYPVLGLVSAQLNAPSPASDAEGEIKKGGSAVGKPEMAPKHHAGMMDLLASELGVDVEDIYDFELSLYDVQPAVVGGLNNELLFAPRMDNLMSSYAAVEALAQSYTSLSDTQTTASAILLFDHEEVGSVSHHGAESSMFPHLVQRLTSAGIALSATETKERSLEVALAKSFLISADMGHGVHPNYTEKHHELLAPTLGEGVVLKTNAGQKYTSNAPTTFLIRRVAKLAGVPLQEFEVRNDSACGSTIGPHLSVNVRTVDVGLAQLSMHSIRETAGVKDVPYYVSFMQTFFEQYGTLDQELTVD